MRGAGISGQNKTHLWPQVPSFVAQLVKNLPAMWETWVRSLGWEDTLEKGKAAHSSILAWRIPWTYSSWGCKEMDTTERPSLHGPQVAERGRKGGGRSGRRGRQDKAVVVRQCGWHKTEALTWARVGNHSLCGDERG